MITIEINWGDLTPEKQQELIEEGVYHENIDLSPLAIIDFEIE